MGPDDDDMVASSRKEETLEASTESRETSRNSNLGRVKSLRGAKQPVSTYNVVSVKALKCLSTNIAY